MICVALCRCCTCSISFTGTLPLPAHRKSCLEPEWFRSGNQLHSVTLLRHSALQLWCQAASKVYIVHVGLKILPPLLRLGSEVSREGVFALLALRGRADTGACSGSGAAVPASSPSPCMHEAHLTFSKKDLDPIQRQEPPAGAQMMAWVCKVFRDTT